MTKLSLQMISAFSKKQGDSGGEYFQGWINLEALRKGRLKEIEVVLMPIQNISPGLVHLIKPSSGESPDLLMFAALPDEPVQKNKKRSQS